MGGFLDKLKTADVFAVLFTAYHVGRRRHGYNIAIWLTLRPGIVKQGSIRSSWTDTAGTGQEWVPGRHLYKQ